MLFQMNSCMKVQSSCESFWHECIQLLMKALSIPWYRIFTLNKVSCYKHIWSMYIYIFLTYINETYIDLGSPQKYLIYMSKLSKNNGEVGIKECHRIQTVYNINILTTLYAWWRTQCHRPMPRLITRYCRCEPREEMPYPFNLNYK